MICLYTIYYFFLGRNLATLGHTTEEDDSDAGEETSRVVHNIVSSGKDRRSGVRRALDGFLGNDVSVQIPVHPNCCLAKRW